MISLPMKLAAIAVIAIAVIGTAYAANLVLNSSTTDNPETTPNPTMTPTSSATSTPKPTNTSAIITFTVKPTIVSHTYLENNTRGEPESTRYDVNIQITWDKNQAPYVRYYEITPHYNGNLMPTQKIWGGATEYREWGVKPWATLDKFPWVENEVYYIGPGDITYANPRNFITIYDNNLDWRAQGLHGVGVGGLSTTYDWVFDDSSATQADLEATERAMDEFAQNYFEGWTFTIKPVS
jgi:hypothetical protein